VGENDQHQDDSAGLRRRAEVLWRKQSADRRNTSHHGADIPLEEALNLLHELEVHQIELEMQNEELRSTQDELAVSHARYFDLYDLAPVGYLTLSEKGLILEANLAAANLLGLERSQFVNQPVTRFIVPDDQDIYYLQRKRLSATLQPQVCELRMLRGGPTPPAAPTVHGPRGLGHRAVRSGAAAVQAEPEQEAGGPLWVRLQATVTQSGADAPVWRVTLSDITEQKQAQDSLRASEARLRALLTNAPVVLFAIDGAGIVTFADGRGLAGMGFAPEEVHGRPAYDVFAEQPVIRAAIQRALAGEAFTRVAQIAGMWFDIRLLPLPEPDQRVAGVIGVAMDVTARKRAENALQQAHDDLELRVQERTAELRAANEALRQSRDQLQSLTRRLVDAQENERAAIARELHDGAGQALTVMLLDLGALARQTADNPDTAAKVQALQAAADGLMSELHTLAANLHPATLNRLGLLAAVRQHISSLQDTAGLQIVVKDVELDDNSLSPEVRIAVYRVIQEAVNNAIRHAQARNIGVLLAMQESCLRVTIEDDGSGFNPETPDEGQLGLLSMRERIEMLGGSLTIESSPGAGTTVFVEVRV